MLRSRRALRRRSTIASRSRLAMLLEDLGLAGRGEAAARVRAGYFNQDGQMPLNTHGGLLSYGHCGVGGAMAHLVEIQSADDRPRRQSSGATPRSRCCTGRRRAVVACQHVPGARAMSEPIADWTQGCGSHRLSDLQRLRRAAIFPPAACAACGSSDPRRASRQRGRDGVCDLAGLCRAATPETRAHVPYNILLVDTDEGFRMMAHGDNDLAIGDKVSARFTQFAGRLVPYFAKTK